MCWSGYHLPIRDDALAQRSTDGPRDRAELAQRQHDELKVSQEQDQEPMSWGGVRKTGEGNVLHWVMELGYWLKVEYQVVIHGTVDKVAMGLVTVEPACRWMRGAGVMSAADHIVMVQVAESGVMEVVVAAVDVAGRVDKALERDGPWEMERDLGVVEAAGAEAVLDIGAAVPDGEGWAVGEAAVAVVACDRVVRKDASAEAASANSAYRQDDCHPSYCQEPMVVALGLEVVDFESARPIEDLAGHLRELPVDTLEGGRPGEEARRLDSGDHSSADL